MCDRIGEGDGWVKLSLLLSFNRMRRTNLGVDELAAVLEPSEELELDGGRQRVRRRVPYAP